MTGATDLPTQIWDMKYRLKDESGQPIDGTREESWRRVATALAAVEAQPDLWSQRFFAAMSDHRFLPAGRIIAGAGTERAVTLFNCFVMGEIPDSMGGIFAHLREAALTLQQGGGIGYDFSSLRPRGARVKGVGADASGPLSFMDVWDAMCRTIMSAGHRRGAMMGTLRCDHPDIEAFVQAKSEAGRLTNFNLSVLVTDAFMAAVEADADWPLIFAGKTYGTLRARALWNRIMRATYEASEPGVIFIDRINRLNPLAYCEEIHATNPCGEQPLPPYGACLLGSINLAQLVRRPFTATAGLDLEALDDLTALAVRALDNAIDISRFPLEHQRREAEAKRRIGLGITGLADALIMCGLTYGSREAVTATETWMARLQRAAYLASSALAAEKGSFPLFDAEAYLATEGARRLPEEVRQAIAATGLRNGLLTSVAPTGTISILADNVSSGLEPVFAFEYSRKVLLPDGSHDTQMVTDLAMRRFRALKGDTQPLPPAFVDAQNLDPAAHLVMQAAVQRYIDSSVSKTINLPEDIGFEAFKDVYRQAYDLGCKGCTTYRPSSLRGAVLETPAGDAAEDGAGASAPPSQTTAAVREGGVAQLEPGSVVYMTRPLDRPAALPGRTYKLTWPESDHAIYITLNDVVQDGRRRPFEIFINSKNMEHYAWTVALTRMISAVFRRGGDVAFVVEELKAVFDPRGGAWMQGRYVPSLLAAIGEVIEEHMIAIGFLPEPVRLAKPRRPAVNAEDPTGTGESAEQLERVDQCPKCGGLGLVHQEGCDLCTLCGYSRCL
ncbi:adenosylcobalamin-dependent ribonucleoside-diphosphate reductase [Algihabitans albus]|uniref:adenosylcobalamin-dependent ribonucleoside-diphosphate reductase n=1 Tax=Algihabitans albus TaxID=2164067 RepID=UPI000E5D3F84|nr:adenosylcobalamin-dependent ribonucleoside-diphosphate reductase [Algihabitans albus]